MLLLWLGTLALTASPQLHSLLHRDAQNLDHNCLVTQIQRGSLLAGLVAIIALLAPLTVVGVTWRANTQILPSFDYRLAPSRAPPFGFSSKTVVG